MLACYLIKKKSYNNNIQFKKQNEKKNDDT